MQERLRFTSQQETPLDVRGSNRQGNFQTKFYFANRILSPKCLVTHNSYGLPHTFRYYRRLILPPFLLVDAVPFIFLLCVLLVSFKSLELESPFCSFCHSFRLTWCTIEPMPWSRFWVRWRTHYRTRSSCRLPDPPPCPCNHPNDLNQFRNLESKRIFQDLRLDCRGPSILDPSHRRVTLHMHQQTDSSPMQQSRMPQCHPC